MAKKWISGVLLVAVVIAMTGCGRVQLFNGKDFEGWKLHLDDKSVAPQTVWSVKDGVVHCKGKPNGYMRTLDVHSDYKLHVEWRWADEPTNSGVLLHAGGEDKVWPRCIEAQLKHERAGDFVLIGHPGITVDDKRYQDDNQMYVVVDHKLDGIEKPAGQWNMYDIYCKGNTIKVYVNGRLQNEAIRSTETKGWICLQSEGSPIEFRNIWIEPLK